MIYFFLGLTIGLGFLLWRQTKVNEQLTEIVDSLSQFEQIKSLPKINQVRRSVNLLNKDYEQLFQEKELIQNILDIAPIGYLKIDAENHLIECNQEAKKLLSIQRWDPNKYRLFLELVRSYELDQLIQQTRKTEQILTRKWDFYPTTNYILEEEDHNNEYQKEKYEPIFLKAYTFPLENEEVVIFIKNRQLIKNLSHRRDQAYTDLSHELRTPLTSMSLLAETLLKHTEDNNKIWTQQIYQEINRLINLVENWLKVIQWDQNPYENLQYQNLELKQLILSTWNSLAALAEQEKISMNYEGPESVMIQGDINCLTQVFVNLFDNSIKHSFSQGLIRVEIEQKKLDKKDVVVINIIDQGSGFNEVDLPHIFERLYRGDKSRVRTTKEGSGLGLSIVKEIVNAHGGLITAQNHPETGGAWFEIILPRETISD